MNLYEYQSQEDQSLVEAPVEYPADMMPELPPEKVHYVNNDEMLAAWLVYQEDRKKAQAEGKPDPVVPRFLADCILKICNHTAYKHNFINYSFRDEMIL